MGVLQRLSDWVSGKQDTTLEAVAYNRSKSDVTTRLSPATLTPQDISVALDAAARGNRARIGRIHDLMFASDTDIRAAAGQLKSAVAQTEFQTTPGDDSDGAKQEADELNVMLLELPVRRLKAYAVDAWLRGGGLVENVWNPAGEIPRRVTGWRFVPEQRIRQDEVTGETAFAASVQAEKGTPVSAYDRGKWITIDPDPDLAAFELRGVAAALRSLYFARLNVMGWWGQRLERFGMPIPVVKSSGSGQAKAKQMIQEFGASMGLSIGLQDEATVVGGDSAVGATSPHAEFMLRTGQMAFLATLGESQTGIIEQGAGSKQSAETQRAIARYVIADVCALIAEAVARDFIAPWREIRGYAGKWPAPKWAADLDEQTDALVFDDLVTRAKAHGVLVSETYYRDQTRLPAPKEGETPLGVAAPAARPVASDPMRAEAEIARRQARAESEAVA